MSRGAVPGIIACLLCLLLARPAAAERYAIVIAGASGGQEYAQQYATWTAALDAILVERMRLDRRNVILLSDSDDPKTRATAANVRSAFGRLRPRLGADDLLLVVLIGHGSFDGVDAKFNLVGPDLESGQWSELLDAVPGQVVVVNTTAGSFPFIGKLSGPRRIVISATDSPAQRFATVFPEHFIAAFREESADIDKNGRISIWEAFAAATAGVRRHYQQRGQLATERALLDDNGDGTGHDLSAAADDGSLASRTYLDEALPGAAPTDEVLLRLMQSRTKVEAELEELKVRRAFMPPGDYQQELERLMIELARVSRDIRARIKS